MIPSSVRSAASAGDLPDPEALFRERLRRGTWVMVAGTIGLALGELVLRPGENPAVSLAHVSLLIAFFTMMRLERRCTTRRQIVLLALAGMVLTAVTSAMIALFTGRATVSMLVFVSIAVTTAAYIPWGGVAQAVLVAILAAIYPVEAYLAEGGVSMQRSREMVALYVVLGGSIYIAVELERQRRATARAHEERRRREVQIDEQRAYLRQVLDINPHLIFAKDRSGRFTFVNRALAAVYDTSVDELIGKTDADFNPHAEEVQRFRRDDLEVMDTGVELYVREEVVTDAAGASRWVRTIKRPIFAADGRADQVLGVATDITEQRRFEIQLQEEAEIAGTLARIGQETIAALGRPDLLERLCQVVGEALAADVTQMWLLDPDTQAFTAAAHWGGLSEEWEAARVLRVPRQQVDRYLGEAGGDDVLVLAPHDGDGALAVPWLPLPGGAGVAVLLRRGGELGGALLVGCSRGAYQLDARGGRIARGIAQLASLALENARLVEQLDAGQPAEVGVRRHHVARAAHAAQRHHRLQRAAARRRVSARSPPSRQPCCGASHAAPASCSS